MLTPDAIATRKALAEVREAVQAIDGTIHPAVAMSTLAVLIRVFGTRQTRITVKTKTAIIALIDALREEIAR